MTLEEFVKEHGEFIVCCMEVYTDNKHAFTHIEEYNNSVAEVARIKLLMLEAEIGIVIPLRFEGK